MFVSSRVSINVRLIFITHTLAIRGFALPFSTPRPVSFIFFFSQSLLVFYRYFHNLFISARAQDLRKIGRLLADIISVSCTIVTTGIKRLDWLMMSSLILRRSKVARSHSVKPETKSSHSINSGIVEQKEHTSEDDNRLPRREMTPVWLAASLVSLLTTHWRHDFTRQAIFALAPVLSGKTDCL